MDSGVRTCRQQEGEITIVETAKANGVESHAYLLLLFSQLPYAKSVQAFEALLPWNVKMMLGEKSPSREVAVGGTL